MCRLSEIIINNINKQNTTKDMKKLLLSLAVVLCTSAVVWADEEDITPNAYNYNNVTSFSYAGYYTGANITVPVWTTVDGDNLYDEGLVVVAGGQFGNTAQTYATDLAAGTSLFDFGGTVGQVLVVSGIDSDINDELYELYGVETNIPSCTSSLNWFNIDWFSDPNNTPTGDDNVIHVSLELNIYSKEFGANAIVNCSYPMDNQNNVQPNGSNTAENVAINSMEFCKWWDEDELGTDAEGDYEEEDGTGDYIWNPERWLTYSFDCTMPESDSSDYIPFRVKTEINQTNLASSTIFFRNVKITYEAGGDLTYTTTRNRSWTYYTVEPSGITSVTADREANLYSVNGNEVSFEAGAQIYTISGALVDTANAGDTKTLSKGFYVAKVGDKGVKFVIR